MMINTENLVPISEANQNFSKVARMVDEKGSVILLKNNIPRYVIIEYSKISENSTPKMEGTLADDETVIAIARKILDKYQIAFDELAND